MASKNSSFSVGHYILYLKINICLKSHYKFDSVALSLVFLVLFYKKHVFLIKTYKNDKKGETIFYQSFITFQNYC